MRKESRTKVNVPIDGDQSQAVTDPRLSCAVNLRELCAEEGLSLKALARWSGVKLATIIRLSRAEPCKIELDELDRIAKALDSHAGFLVGSIIHESVRDEMLEDLRTDGEE